MSLRAFFPVVLCVAPVLKEGGYEAAAGWADSVEEGIAAKVHELHQKLSK